MGMTVGMELGRDITVGIGMIGRVVFFCVCFSFSFSFSIRCCGCLKTVCFVCEVLFVARGFGGLEFQVSMRMGMETEGEIKMEVKIWRGT